tara:strand:- start:4424 stop:4990 length:567 start_codon:yes stop_codon:yes gene_type:complete
MIRVEATKVSASKLKPHPNNPRYIDEHKFTELKESITDSEWMMQIRPIIIDENFIVLCGNMRYKACLDLGISNVWVKQYTDLTKEEKQELILKDNISSGDWSEEILEKDWSDSSYKKWMGSQPISYDDLDYDDLSLDLDSMEGNVKRSIHLKIDRHIEDILVMIKSLRDNGVYVGKVLIDALREVKRN